MSSDDLGSDLIPSDALDCHAIQADVSTTITTPCDALEYHAIQADALDYDAIPTDALLYYITLYYIALHYYTTLLDLLYTT